MVAPTPIVPGDTRPLNHTRRTPAVAAMRPARKKAKMRCRATSKPSARMRRGLSRIAWSPSPNVERETYTTAQKNPPATRSER